MQNFVKPGKTMTYTAPSGGVTSGNVYLIGALFVVSTNTIAATLPFEGETDGVFTLAKNAGEGNLVEGQALFWDNTNLWVTTDATAGLPIGTVATQGGALSAATACDVRLHGVSLVGRTLTLRKRLAIAAINAGATLLPALPGVRYRVVDALAIAVGGAVTTVTTVNLLGTQSTASVKLVAFGQAALTESALVRAGASGGVLLADGASLAPNDIDTAITVGVTGSAITVATSVDFEVVYSLE